MTREIGDIIRLWESRPARSFALATLVRSRGSSYRLPGARMLICEDGTYAGSLSGGCLEHEVLQRAQRVIRDEEPFFVSIDTRLRFGCRGAIDILVEPVREAFLHELALLQGLRRAGRAATSFAENTAAKGTRWLLDGEIPVLDDFVQEITPALQLVVIGDGTDCEALRRLSDALGWSSLQVQSIAELKSPLDRWTAVLVKTHNYGRDFAALRLLLPMNLPYIGLLGPRRRREEIMGDLIDTGVKAERNFFAPAGQDLGGDSPESIALAVIAEIHAVFKGRPGNHLRDLRLPIHRERDQTLANDSNHVAPIPPFVPV